MPGILTGSAALLTAVGGLIAVLIQAGVIGNGDDKTPAAASGQQGTTVAQATTWAVQANRICERANEAIEDLPKPEASNVQSLGLEGMVEVGRDALRINRRMVRQLAALSGAEEDAAEIDAFVRLAANINEATEELLVDLRTGNVLAAQKQASEVSRLGERFDERAIDLGATTCAEGASSAALALPSQ